MRSIIKAFGCVLILSAMALAQGDRGTITGAVTDPAGAVIGGAAVKAKNAATGAEYSTITTNTGNYTLAQLLPGPYELSVSMSGFKTLARTGLTVVSAQIMRIDAALEIGAISETVSVDAAAALLKTESGELSHTIQGELLNNLPVFSIGSYAGTTGIRNPYAVIQMLPGADFTPDNNVKVNGAPSNTQGLRVEGMDATNNMWQQMSQYTQTGVEAVQEFGIQTSNYAAEYGQAGTAVFNLTMKSGTNQLHGSAYDYFVNEALNAGTPFTSDGTGGKLRPRNRRNDFGFTVGGPVYLPKMFNGRDRAFFFFSFEQYRQATTTNSFVTVPTLAMRKGDFSAIQGAAPLKNSSGNVITDVLGRPVYQNTIYDPSTERVVNGVRVWDPFLGNKIPQERWDPAALAVQSYMYEPGYGGADASKLTNNAMLTVPASVVTWIPSVKVDYSISPRAKVSGFWSRNSYAPGGSAGLPAQITSFMPTPSVNHTVRLNFDYTVKPTMLLHLGAGLMQTVLTYNAGGHTPQKDLKIPGGTDANPYLTTMINTTYGGYSPATGPAMDVRFVDLKPTANPSLTWIKGNHSYKFGGELVVESHPDYSRSYANNYYYFSPNQTADPSLSLSGTTLPSGTAIGFAYASFLMGNYNQVTSNTTAKGHLGNHAFAFYAQDSWKITSKVTLDYGLRYDFQTYLKEQYGRMGSLVPSAMNPKVGLPGAIQYEGNGQGHCNCAFGKNYPYAFGPRLGLAWQMLPKTVLRAGIGISYGKTTELGYLSNQLSGMVSYQNPGQGLPAGQLSTGVPPGVTPTWPTTDTSAYPHLPSLDPPAMFYDYNMGRPSRTVQWSFGIQREITKDLLLEVSYVGNRGAWWYAGALRDWNALTPEDLKSKWGLDVGVKADRDLLVNTLGAAQAKYPGRFTTPFAGFPAATATLAQALAPFPQFSSMNLIFAPLGRTWYDALQANLNKRFAHNFSFQYSFTWQKELYSGAENSYWFGGPRNALINDVANRSVNKYMSGLSRPLMHNIALSYTTPRVFAQYKMLSLFLRDWQINIQARYRSGYLLQVPVASSNLPNALHRSATGGAVAGTPTTFANRVPGQPVFMDQSGNAIDINSRNWDPSQAFVLNPKAWTEPDEGKFGTSAAYYSDYRSFRHPQENVGLARNFRFGRDGRMNLNLRAEFTNIFNRLYLPDPTATNAGATQTKSSTGQPTGGFGYINLQSSQIASNVRMGQIVARLSF